MDLTDTIEADSTQINADDLPAPRTVTVTGVNKGTAEQPVNIEVAEFPGRAYRPCKSMRRVLVSAWGSDATQYVGRRLTIFNDPSVRWGGLAVGGVRISHLSHIDKPLTIALTESRGKRKPHRTDPLPDAPPALPTVTPEAAAEFERDIAEAATIQALDAVAKDLKACDLGSHRARLLTSWSERKAVIEAAE
jgi:hypothetical protein